MNERRVVITGMGCVTPAGNDVRSTWEALVAGRGAARTVAKAVESRMQCTIGAEVTDFRPPALKQDVTRLARCTQLAMAAAMEAAADAGLPGNVDLARAGVLAGTGIGDGAEHVRTAIPTPA